MLDIVGWRFRDREFLGKSFSFCSHRVSEFFVETWSCGAFGPISDNFILCIGYVTFSRDFKIEEGRLPTFMNLGDERVVEIRYCRCKLVPFDAKLFIFAHVRNHEFSCSHGQS